MGRHQEHFPVHKRGSRRSEREQRSVAPHFLQQDYVRVARDPGSMAKVIRWTTSPAYRLLGPVSSDSDRIRRFRGWLAGLERVLLHALSTKSDLTVNCAFLSSWVHASITFASRCTNRTQSGRHRCDGKLLERTCPRSNCISTGVRFNLDSIWGIHDLG